MRKTWILFSLLFFYGVRSGAQEQLTGRIIDFATQKPVAAANVFLSNTSIGTISQEDGRFIIPHFPTGHFQLVVSCVGYETFVMAVQSSDLSVPLLIKLKPVTNELKEVIVEAYDKNGWRTWGALFYEQFIGNEEFSNDCHLVNKEAVRFRLNKGKEVLRAFSNETLIIENRSLGYKIRYALVTFIYNLSTQTFHYEGYPLFEEMTPKNEAEKKRWQAKREQAYRGSMMQFMRSLFRNKFAEDHFEVRKVVSVSPEERKRVQGIYARQSAMIKEVVKKQRPATTTLSEDSALYYQVVMDHPEAGSLALDKIIPRDSISFVIGPTVVGLYFPGRLQISYPPKKNPKEYANKFLENGAEYLPVSSEIVLLDDQPVKVLMNGAYYEGINLVTSGFWSWSEKLVRMLPYEYWPGDTFKFTRQ